MNETEKRELAQRTYVDRTPEMPDERCETCRFRARPDDKHALDECRLLGEWVGDYDICGAWEDEEA